MSNDLKSIPLSRRRFLGAGAALIAAPAIIGRASVASAEKSFAGEELIVMSWSGNYETVFKETVIDPFNAQYGTAVESTGGWDQMVPQILAAPADTPPFDITIGEEYVSIQGIAQGLFLKNEVAALPNLGAVYPYFDETRPGAEGFGVPFAIGTCMLLMRKSLDIAPDSWNLLWDERLAGKVTVDGSAWHWPLSLTALTKGASHKIDEMYSLASAEPLFAEIDKLRPARWYMTGAEQATVLNQGEADAAQTYSSDAFGFLQDSPDEYVAAVPKEGTSGWTDRFFKVRGTRHNNLANLFSNYLLEKETQERFLAKSMVFMSRKDVTAPDHSKDYPRTNEDVHGRFQLITMKGWEKITADYATFDSRMKLSISRSADQ
ncbi:PotD/PotF family extracellular solute-binding protein [Shinella sp.]|uniref:ABC transporter substrate-binding protein n=1 Tax=Shinella sp. TaxID=1870904 RepID=UPI0028B215DC|nr:extracellular solute-binding protein [Shinella sp.]